MMLILVLLSGSANRISYDPLYLAISGILLIFLCLVLNKLNELIKIIPIYFIIFIYFIVYMLKFDVIDFGFIARFLALFTIPYCIIILINKNNFFIYMLM